MNTQGQQFIGTRGFRIGVLAVLAVVVLVGAAYFFGTGLLADTSASISPSPLGSSLTANKGSTGAVAGRSASAALFGADYASLGLPAASAGFATADYASLGLPAASAGFATADYASLGLPAAGTTESRPQSSPSSMNASSAAGQDPWIKPEEIKPRAAADPTADQSPWVKPEGITSK
jgi:hypothetical protein